MISMKENQNQSQFPPFSVQTNTTSSLSSSIQLNPKQDHQEPLNDYFSVGGSSNNFELDQAKILGSDKILVKKQRKAQSFHDQVQLDQASSSNNNAIRDMFRVCTNCKTTKTPLWRSGPQGPKSLCNACGIREMKARRAMRVAAERSNMDRTVPFKKRFKINVTSSSAQKKLRLDDITISLTNKFAFQQPFPQEEKDAALLLMALSCGLIYG